MSKKREQIEDFAAEAVQKSGLNNVSFRVIASAVGVKSASVHYHFPEKGDLACALIEKYTVAFCKRLEEIDRHHLKPDKRLRAFIKIFEDVIKADKFCLCGMMAAEVATLNDDARALLANYFKAAEDWLAEVFHSHDDTHLKPRVLARIFMSGLEGAILIDRVTGGTDRLRAYKELLGSL